MSLNKVMLIGNVGRDPEIRYLDGNNGGTKVATFTLATSEKYRDRNGELRENTEWHNIVAWRNSADIAEKYVHKGTQLYIEGRLRTRSYTSQDGLKKYTTEITVDNLQLLSKREGGYDDGYSQGGGYQRQGGYSGGGQGYGQQSAPATNDIPSFGQPAPAQQPVRNTPVQAAPQPDLEPKDDDLPF